MGAKEYISKSGKVYSNMYDLPENERLNAKTLRKKKKNRAKKKNNKR